MLILTRKYNESIVIDEGITITILEIGPGNRVRVGIDAPRDVTVNRKEVHDRLHGLADGEGGEG